MSEVYLFYFYLFSHPLLRGVPSPAVEDWVVDVDDEVISHLIF